MQTFLDKMPRARDIGWQHGKMIGGNSHHVECNYCHRTMIGGITRFKKHLASKRGEIKGCEAVPKEVRELMKKHLAAWRKRKAGKKKNQDNEDALSESTSDDKDTESNESDQEMVTARLESIHTLQEAEVGHQQITNDDQLPLPGTHELFDASSAVQCRSVQGSARRRATDLGWDHGLMVNGDRQKIECKYCHKVILGGGISRLKQHLAGERGNIIPCEEVPEEVKVQMQHHLGFKIQERLKKHKKSEKVKNTLVSSMQGKEEGSDDDLPRSPKESSALTNSGRRKKDGSESSNRKKRQRKQSITYATPVNQHLAITSQESLDQADMAVAKFMYGAGIPLSAANSLYFQLMADAIAAVGPGYRMPTHHSLQGNLLNKTVQQASDLCLELRKSWEATGCTVMADRWTDQTGRTVINVYVYCSKGTMFLKSFDASEISQTSEALFTLFDGVVQDIGPKNIVHFVTDCTPHYKAAGKMLMNKYKTFFWSASVSHCIDLMLEELGKLPEVKRLLSRAKRVCQFIYTHEWLLNSTRKETGGRDIVTPGTTKCMTNILTLQNIMSLKDTLHKMFTSTTWIHSDLSREGDGVEATETVIDPIFWSACDQILKVTNPLLSVLHVSDNEERPSLGYIYDAFEKAKQGIVVGFSYKESEYSPYMKVIDRIWEEELHSPLHAAAYYLNPSLFYNPSFSTNKLIQKGLLDCIETLEPELASQDMITGQITFYENAVGDFNRPVALRGRESLAPATWWSLYAAEYPHLQRFAVRILSQTCSATQCERNSSMFELTHLKKNKLEHDRVENLIFVHYNLLLQERQTTGNKVVTKRVQDATCLEGMDVGVGDWIEDSMTLDLEESWLDRCRALKADNSNYVSLSRQ